MSRKILSEWANNAIQTLDETVDSVRADLNKQVTIMEISPDVLKRNVPDIENPTTAFKEFKAAFFRQNPNAKPYAKDLSEITSTKYVEKGNTLLILAKNFYALRSTLTKTSRDPKLVSGELGIEKYKTKAGKVIERSRIDIGHTSEGPYEGKDTVAGVRIQLLANSLPPGSGNTLLNKYINKLNIAHKPFRTRFSKVYNKNSEVNAELEFVYTVPQDRKINAELAKKEQAIIRELRGRLDTLRSSPSVIDIIVTAITNTFLYGKPKIKLKTTTEIKGKRRPAKPRIKLKAAAFATTKVDTKDQEISTVRLQTLINLRLHDQIRKNMGKGRSKQILNYRTGRFAKSAEVQAVLGTSRNNFLDIYYTYQRFPYDTFLPGGRLYKPGRDPRTIIGRSIRQLATEFVSNNFKVNPILKGGT